MPACWRVMQPLWSNLSVVPLDHSYYLQVYENKRNGHKMGNKCSESKLRSDALNRLENQ